MQLDTHIVLCSCSSAEHLVRFMYDGEDVYVEIQLHPYKSIFQRLILGIKYIFGHNSKYGHWDITTLDKAETRKLYYFLKKYKDDA